MLFLCCEVCCKVIRVETPVERRVGTRLYAFIRLFSQSFFKFEFRIYCSFRFIKFEMQLVEQILMKTFIVLKTMTVQFSNNNFITGIFR